MLRSVLCQRRRLRTSSRTSRRRHPSKMAFKLVNFFVLGLLCGLAESTEPCLNGTDATTTCCTCMTQPALMLVCYRSCPDGFYGMENFAPPQCARQIQEINNDDTASSILACFSCHASCETCYGEGKRKCNRCAEGHTSYDNGLCLDDPPIDLVLVIVPPCVIVFMGILLLTACLIIRCLKITSRNTSRQDLAVISRQDLAVNSRQDFINEPYVSEFPEYTNYTPNNNTNQIYLRVLNDSSEGQANAILYVPNPLNLVDRTNTDREHQAAYLSSDAQQAVGFEDEDSRTSEASDASLQWYVGENPQDHHEVSYTRGRSRSSDPPLTPQKTAKSLRRAETGGSTRSYIKININSGPRSTSSTRINKIKGNVGVGNNTIESMETNGRSTPLPSNWQQSSPSDETDHTQPKMI